MNFRPRKCLNIRRNLKFYADSCQIRSSLIFKHGVYAVEQFRAAFFNKEETHIINHGQDIVQMCIKSWTDWISVMAGISKPVIHGVSTLANQKNKRVMLDLLDTKLIGQSTMDEKTRN